MWHRNSPFLVSSSVTNRPDSLHDLVAFARVLMPQARGNSVLDWEPQ